VLNIRNAFGLATGWGVAGALDGWLGTGWSWLGRDNLAVTGDWDSRLVPAVSQSHSISNKLSSIFS